MKRARTTALITSTTLLAAVGPVLGSGAAHAAATPAQEVVVYLAAAADTGSYGVYRRPTAGGPAVQLVAPDDEASRFDLAVSQDGSRFAYVEETYDDEGDFRTRVIVRDVNGPLKRAVLDKQLPDGQSVSDVALSPDGRSVVFTLSTYAFSTTPSASFVLYRSSVFGSPSAIPGSTGLVDPTFVSPTTLLANKIAASAGPGFDFQGLRSIPVTGGAQSAVSGPPGITGDYRVSPAGNRVLWSAYDEASEGGAGVTGDLAVNGSAVTITSDEVSVVSDPLDYSLSWRLDGASIFFTRAFSDNEDNSDLWTATVGGGTNPAAFDTTPTVDEYEVVVAKIDAVAPGAITSTSPATLAGATATIPLDSVPTDTDWSGTYVRRTAGGATRTTLAPVGAAVADTSMVVGTTYSYTFAAVDSSGNLGAWSAPRLVTATAAPVLTTADPTSATSVRASFPVVLSSANAPSTTYFVGYGRNAAPSVPWLNGVQGGTQVFGSAAAPGRAATTSVPGSTYQFLAFARDAHGNRTALIKAARNAVVPFDNGSLTPAGATQTVARAGAYGGTSLFLKAAGGQAAIRIAGDRVQVIGERGTATGRFVVYDNGVRVAVVDTRAAGPQTRQVLYTRTLTTTTNHTIVVRAEGTAGRPFVVLDGLSTRRS